MYENNIVAKMQFGYCQVLVLADYSFWRSDYHEP